MLSYELWNKFAASMPIACVNAIICSNKGFLLVKRMNKPAKNKWWFIGGRIKHKQKLLDALHEQIFEETEYLKEDYMSSFLNVSSSIFNDRHVVEINFLVRIKTDRDPVLNFEHSEYKWVTHDNLPEEIRKYLVNDFNDFSFNF